MLLQGFLAIRGTGPFQQKAFFPKQLACKGSGGLPAKVKAAGAAAELRRSSPLSGPASQEPSNPGGQPTSQQVGQGSIFVNK